MKLEVWEFVENIEVQIQQGLAMFEHQLNINSDLLPGLFTPEYITKPIKIRLNVKSRFDNKYTYTYVFVRQYKPSSFDRRETFELQNVYNIEGQYALKAEYEEALVAFFNHFFNEQIGANNEA